MVRHVVLLTFRDDTPEEHVAAVVDALRQLPDQIPELRNYVVGTDLGLADGNADVVAVADFDDEAGYVVYRDHPEHVRVITEMIRPQLAGRVAIQHAC